MPHLRLQTNASVTESRKTDFLAAASQLVSTHLEKDEKYFMGIVEAGQAMLFGGSDAPLACLELSALGLPTDKTSLLSRDLCELVHEQLAVPRERIYLKFDPVERGLWGWNGDVF